ncbi:MAG: D-alanyl-D-alanine carboxypeptidase/D-alanyl-D-alanine-endopeptidase [Deltaproteobacteria bacterium]|nr:D-alanyl-D-alanine carboxypeptidase/D-alanyl-D-alanine-endopeptidase [Deltaproteobacteria bacterium]
MMSLTKRPLRAPHAGIALAALLGALCVSVGASRDASAQRTAKAKSRQAAAPPSPGGVAPSYGVPLADAVETLHKAVRHYGGQLGISVVDLKSDRVVAARDVELALNPASNAKLLTAWAALKALGAQHRYFTGLYGKIRDDRVDTLVLRGDGDPQLEHQHLYEMAAQLRLAGVRMIGDVVVDQSRFDERQDPPAYDQQPHEWASFRAPIAAVSVDGNTVHVTVFPAAAGQVARSRATPPSAVDLVGSVGTTAANSAETVRLDVFPLREGRLRASISGTVAASSPPVTVWRRIGDPTWLAGHALSDICRELDITVHGKVRRGHPMPQDLLASHRSRPLGEIVQALGKDSDNFKAEMIFKGLAPATAPASFEAARARLFELLTEARIDATGVKMTNGSGLFDADRMSAAFITSLLTAASRDPAIAPEFISQLAIGGVDGTLRNRFGELSKTRSIRAKSGTLRAVSTLSGFVMGTDGAPRVAFSILVNDVVDASTELRQEIDAVVSAAASVAAFPPP